MDAVLLARIQFALTVGFHFIFPPISIGLAWLIVILERIGWKKNDEAFVRLGKFFGKLFTITFAVGVATGIVMEFQFGTNWAEYSKFVGDIFGAPLAAEGVLAFFLESGFLGLYLFGRNRVSKRMHWFSSLMVAFGATLSAFWIIVANSWQQTPAGYVVQNGRAELTNFWDAVFNPSSLIRYFHTVDAALITGAFFMMGVSAYLILKKKEAELMKKSFKIALIFGFISSIIALFPTGHEHSKQVAATQPEKLAAIEGLFQTQKSAPLILFGIPTNNPPEIKAKIEIPGLLSLIAYGDINATVKGLNDFPPDQIPPVFLPFVSYHTMVGFGMFFICITGLGMVFLWKKNIWDKRIYLKILVWSLPLPILTCQLGWIAAEVGRQPWIVYGLLKTKDAISLTVPSGNILFSIILFGLIYLLLGILYVYLIGKEIKHGPEQITKEEVKA